MVRVSAPVARRTPHRSGREGFHSSGSSVPGLVTGPDTKQVTTRLAHNFAALDITYRLWSIRGFGSGYTALILLNFGPLMYPLWLRLLSQ